MTNNADPDQLVSSELQCLQRQDIFGFSRTRVKTLRENPDLDLYCLHVVFILSTISLPKNIFLGRLSPLTIDVKVE